MHEFQLQNASIYIHVTMMYMYMYIVQMVLYC